MILRQKTAIFDATNNADVHKSLASTGFKSDYVQNHVYYAIT